MKLRGLLSERVESRGRPQEMYFVRVVQEHKERGGQDRREKGETYARGVVAVRAKEMTSRVFARVLVVV